MSTTNTRDTQQDLVMQHSQTKVHATAAYKSGPDKMKNNMQQALSQLQAQVQVQGVPTNSGPASVQVPSTNAAHQTVSGLPSVPNPRHPCVPLQPNQSQNQQGRSTTAQPAQPAPTANNNINYALTATASSTATIATAPTPRSAANNQESSSTSTTSSSVSHSSHPQHIIKPLLPSPSQPQPSASNSAGYKTNTTRDIVPYSTSTSTSSDALPRALAPAPTVPISVMALPHNTPNFQSNTSTNVSIAIAPSPAVVAMSNQHLSIAERNQQPANTNTITQNQPQQIPQKQISPTVTKYASVPTTKLASKSVISLTPSFLQSLNNQRIHNIGRTSSSSLSSSSSSSNAMKQSCGTGRNDKKRRSPDADKQQAKKMSKGINDLNVGNSSTPGGIGSNNAAAEKSPFVPSPNKPVTLQSYFDNLLKSRGYSTLNYCSLENAYCCKPSALQIASHGLKVIQGVRKSDTALLTSLLDAGLSPNPCNKFGESIIHMICRRGDHDLLKLFMKYGCSLQVCDDFGRTPLHDACWTSKPNFEIIDLILTKDRRLMNIVDCRGSSPLSYVKREHWNDWIQFFERVKEKFWSYRDVKSVGEEPAPELVGKAPNSITLTSPRTGAKIEDITLVAMGKIDPEIVKSRLKKDEQLREDDQEMKSITTPTPLPQQHLVIH